MSQMARKKIIVYNCYAIASPQQPLSTRYNISMNIVKRKDFVQKNRLSIKKILLQFKIKWAGGDLFTKTTILIACLALLICCGGGVKIVKDKLESSMSAMVSLTYQEAADGLNPNGTRFNPYLMVSEDVINQTEEKLGVTIDQEDLWLSFPQITNKSNYTTDFYVNYKGPYNKKEVLETVVTIWANLFEENYTYNNSSVLYTDSNEDTDYIYLVTWLTNEANEIASYAKTRMKEDNVYSLNGITFKNIYDSANNIIDVDIENFKTYITTNGVSNDTVALVNSITYKDRLLSDKKTNYEAQYQNRRGAISLYDMTLFPTISVPSVSNGIYYITTTKTGLDYIYDAAANASSNSLSTQRMISDDQLLIANMDEENGTNTEVLKQATNLYKQLKEQISSLGKQLKELDDSYNSTQIEPYYRIQIDGETFSPVIENETCDINKGACN